MNSSTSEVLWPSPVGAHEASSHIAESQAALCGQVASDILDSINSGSFTSSTTVSGELSQDVQYVAALLNQGGYTVSNDGTNLVVSW